MQTQSLGEGSVGKLLVKLSLPAILAQLVNMLYNIVDRIFIGHIPVVGSDALTGVGVTFPVVLLISAFAVLVGMGGAPRAAIMMGKKDDAAAERIMGNCFSLTILTSILLTAVFLAFGEPLLKLFGASDATVRFGWEYLRVYILGTLFVQISIGMNAFLTTQGFAKESMITVIIGAVLNIILDPIFIYLFDMGVAGAAWATILSQGVGSAWILWFLCSKRSKLRLKFATMRLRKEVILPVLALGISPFIMQSTESLLSICYNTSLQRYGGDIAVGAMTICASIIQFVNMPLTGLCQGAQPIISFNYGAGNLARVKKTFWLLFVICVGYCSLFFLAVETLPRMFASIFSSDAALTDYAAWVLRIYFFGIFASGAQRACQQTFVALDEAKCSIFLALLRKIILLIPLIYILPNFFADKVFSVFLAEPIADIIAACCTTALFLWRFRKIAKNMANPAN